MINRITISDVQKAAPTATVFKLPNGADRSPDAAWICKKRWEALTPEQRRKFRPIAPGLVIELRSTTDELERLCNKMQEYIECWGEIGMVN